MFRRSKNTTDETGPKPGTVMADETLFGGKIGGMWIFAMPEDVQDDEGDRNKLMTHAQALEELARMNAEGRYGHSDWELATPAIMKMLIGNLSASFNTASAKGIIADCYLTSVTVKNGDTLDVKAVNARNNKVFFAPAINDMSVRFIRRVRPDEMLEVANIPHVPAKAGKARVDYRRVIRKMDRGAEERIPAILSRILEKVPEQKKLELLDNLLREAVCLHYQPKIVETLLKAGANPNAEFNGARGEMLAVSYIHHNSSVRHLYRYGASLDDAIHFIITNERSYWTAETTLQLKSWWREIEASEAQCNSIIAAHSRQALKI